MQNRVPLPREARPPLPEFTPVPRKFRHDGWTPERQKAFIEALADTGSVTRAAGMVNIAQRNAYALRRAPGADEFRRAWDAALDFGVQRLKDIAFERAVEGELIPVFVKGRLVGYRRKYNDALLMFCLRNYGQDAQGRRTTISYVSSRAQAGASGEAVAGCVAGGNGEASAGVSAGAASKALAGAAAEASTTTVRTTIHGDGADQAARADALAEIMQGFEGAALDAKAHADISAALEACAARQRTLNAAIEEGGPEALAGKMDDPANSYVEVDSVVGNDAENDFYHGIISPLTTLEFAPDIPAGEWFWHQAGEEVAPQYAALFDQIEQQKAERAAIAEVKRPKRRSGWGPSRKRLAEEGDRAGEVDLSSPDLTEPRADGKGSDYD